MENPGRGTIILLPGPARTAMQRSRAEEQPLQRMTSFAVTFRPWVDEYAATASRAAAMPALGA